MKITKIWHGQNENIKIFSDIFTVNLFVLGVLTIAGPSVIKYGLESYFDEQVELLGVRVSPNLEIGVREVKFNPKIFGWHSIGNGQVRAVKLKW